MEPRALAASSGLAPWSTTLTKIHMIFSRVITLLPLHCLPHGGEIVTLTQIKNKEIRKK